MNHLFINFSQARLGNTFTLLDCKWVIGRLKLYEGPGSVIAEVHSRFEVERIRVRLQPGIQPAEERADMRTLLRLKVGRPLLEARFA